MAKPSTTPLADVLRKAQRHLSRRDPLLKQLIKHVGPCTLQPGADAFPALVRAIIAQMISTLAARAITARVELALQPNGLIPSAVAAATEETLRGAGLSRDKAPALQYPHDHSASCVRPLEGLAASNDDALFANRANGRGLRTFSHDSVAIH